MESSIPILIDLMRCSMSLHKNFKHILRREKKNYTAKNTPSKREAVYSLLARDEREDGRVVGQHNNSENMNCHVWTELAIICSRHVYFHDNPNALGETENSPKGPNSVQHNGATNHARARAESGEYC